MNKRITPKLASVQNHASSKMESPSIVSQGIYMCLVNVNSN